MKYSGNALVLCAVLFVTVQSAAKITLSANKGYRIVCKQFDKGSVLVGSSHGQSTPLFFSETDETSEDAFWIFTEKGEGVYTIHNAQTGKYITYDGERTTEKRYVDLTDAPDGDNSCWRISAAGGGFQIALAANANNRINTRMDDVHIVGTFVSTSGPAANEIYRFVDSDGRDVYDDASMSEAEKFMAGVSSLKIDGKAPVLEQISKEYYLPVKTKYIDNDFIVPVNALLSEGCVLEINGDEVLSGENFNFGNVTGGKSAVLKVKKNGEDYASAKLYFTFMPIVEVEGDNFSTAVYNNGFIRVTDADKEGEDNKHNAGFRYRGATAAGKAKKSYAVKLYDEQGESLDCSFLGMRSDNNWILDAMAIDRARMRNRVSTDLWLDFSTKPYYASLKPKMINGTRGRFVELFLNGSYAGVYCLTEKIDRKQLKLNKLVASEDETAADTIKGVLYKSSEWSYSVLMGHYPDQNTYPKSSVAYANNKSETWDSWEAKYPDLKDTETLDWEPLRTAINAVATGNKYTFAANVGEYFDLPVFRDYYLFIELMLATDNHGKNVYLYSFDKTKYTMMTIAPWDLDGTWGMRWDGSESITSNASQDFVTFLWNHEHGENTLFRMLTQYDYKDWKNGLAQRYAELRENYFNPDSLTKRFASYFDLFKQSGAVGREVARWNNSDGIPLAFESEMTYLDSWIHKRIAYLDEEYGYDPETAGVSPVLIDKFSVSGGNGRILITSENGIKVNVYNSVGMLIRSIIIDGGVTEISGLTPGVYVVNNKKALVR